MSLLKSAYHRTDFMEEIRITVGESDFPPAKMQPPVLVTRSRFADWMNVLRNLIPNLIKVTIYILTSLTKKTVPESNFPPAEMQPRVLVVTRSLGLFADSMNILRNLIPIPIPIKKDRASIVKYAIEYIKELLRAIEEIKVLVERKKVHRKSDLAEFDVQIVKDEVTIKIEQKKKDINCLLFVSKVIDQLQLELYHVAGEEHKFLFKAKICEGTRVHANVIADTIVEVVEKEYMDALWTQLG
ncbi:hypothetical protein AALP_AA1G058900 [Arabis alpina]|uniref:BHLH domain-containing protein n=1 Tax=Arabis alpina TaxID=50452 RepID=A0A087HLE2_ARAAL|nr:hypothetical protein AALP_AA1G058900 [Arabis alpina]